MIVDGTIYADAIAAGFFDVKTSAFGGVYDSSTTDYSVMKIQDDDGLTDPLVTRLLFLDGAGADNVTCALKIKDVAHGNAICIDNCLEGISIGAEDTGIWVNASASDGNAIYSTANSSQPTIVAIQDGAGAAVLALGRSGHGVYGSTSESQKAAIIGVGDFSARGGEFHSAQSYGIYSETGASMGYGLYTPDRVYAVAYESFTGSHVGFSTETPEIGDIMISTGSIIDNPTTLITEVETATTQMDKRAFGVCESVDADINNFIDNDALFTYRKRTDNPETGITDIEIVRKPSVDTVAKSFILSDKNIIHVNALGDGIINVCGENGNIEIGDYICTSSTAGKGMKQDDDLLHNYTVAKALENVTFSTPDEVKQIACTYHCS